MLTALAVLVPAGVLAVLQYRTLVSLQSETPIAIRESLRQTIRAYARSLEERITKISYDSLARLRRLDYDGQSQDELLAGLKEVLSDSPALDQISVAHLCECPSRFAAVVTAGGARIDAGEKAGDWPLGRYLARARPTLPSERASNRLAFLHVEIEREPDFAGLYVFQRSGELISCVRISRKSLLRLVDEVAERRTEDSESGELSAEFHLVHETGGAPINPGSPSSGYELHEPLGEPLTGWALGAIYRGRSISEITRESLRYNLALMAAVLMALVFGVVLSLRAVARQAKLAELKSAFVSNVSHEMRTPLALISLYSETLEMGRVDDAEKVREYQGVIHRESRRLTQMINNVLDFSRIESGRKEYVMEPCEVEEVLRETLADYREPIVAAGFELSLEIAEGLPRVQADRAALSQAILNLVDNAVKYSPDEKKIAVRAYQRQKQVAIEVEDRGAGIPASEQRRIFDTFHRAGDPLTSATRGSGLGLALAKNMAEAHGGRIEVESEAGRGSRFTIVLPAARPSPVPGPREAA